MSKTVNLDAVTLQDCIAMSEILKREVIIEKGHVVEFILNEEENRECTGIRAYKSFS